MIIKPELVKRIKEYFNLNIYETRVWLALLSKGIASAREVADISGVPRSRTYDVLESLEKRGFAITKIGKPVKYIAVKPVEVIEKMKLNTLTEAQEKVKSLATLHTTQEYTELEQLHKTGISLVKTHEITGSVKGRSNILAKLRDLLENAQNEVVICTSIDDFEDKSRILMPTIEKISKSNVKLKLIFSGDTEKIRKLTSKLNIRPKHIDNPARFFISDKKEVLFMVTPENTEKTEDTLAIWLQSPFFTSSLTNLVELSLRNGNGAK